MKIKPKASVQKYLTSSAILALCIILIVGATCILWTDSPWLTILVGFFAILLFSKTVKKLSYKYVFSILYEELDPHRLIATLSENKFLKPSFVHILNATYFKGDFQTAINLCVEKIQTSPMHKKYCLFFLAKIYFSIQDIPKLSKICAIFQERYPRSIRKSFPLIHLFSRYCEQDYESFCSWLQGTKLSKNKTINIEVDYYRAILSYKIGEYEIAKEQFRKIVQKCPKLCFASLSADYIQRIDGQKIAEQPEILPNKKTFFEKKKINTLSIVKYICIGLLTIVLLFDGVNCIFGDTLRKAQLKKSLSKTYKEYEIVEILDIEKDEKLIETVCIVKAQEKIHIGFVKNTRLFTQSFQEHITDALSYKRYYMVSPSTDWAIGVYIYETENKVPENGYGLVETTVNGKDLWICFDKLIIPTIPQR